MAAMAEDENQQNNPEQNNPFVWDLQELIAQEQVNTGHDLNNIFHILDHYIDKLKKFNGKLKSNDFWAVIDIKIRLAETKYTEMQGLAQAPWSLAPSGTTGWGILHYELSTELYEIVNGQVSIMDWRATEAVYIYYLAYKNVRNLNYFLNDIQPDDLFKAYKESHELLVEKYTKLLNLTFANEGFTNFLQGNDVKLANIKNDKHGLIRNVVRSFPNYFKGLRRKPFYLYHYKKMGFLLKTIAECNYLAFDILLNKLNINKHKDLLLDSITLNCNTSPSRKPTGMLESNIRKKFQNIELETENRTSLAGIDPVFNLDNIDKSVSEAPTYGFRDPRNLFIDVAERSGIRERNKHDNQENFTNLNSFVSKRKEEARKKKEELKRPWLFHHSLAGSPGVEDQYREKLTGKIQKGLNTKNILTFLLQHAYETNDRRLFENWEFFSTFGSYNGRRDDVNHGRLNQMYDGPLDFVNPRTWATDEQHSACERYLEYYNKKLIMVAQKFLEKLELPKDILSNRLTDKKVNIDSKIMLIEVATDFFLASIDKPGLESGDNNWGNTGLSNTTTSFLGYPAEHYVRSKRAWLKWEENMLTKKDVAFDLATNYGNQIGTIKLFDEDLDLGTLYKKEWRGKVYLSPIGRIVMINVLNFKQTYNNVFNKQLESQSVVQNLALLDKKRDEHDNQPMKIVMGNEKLASNISSFVRGGKRRKKTKSKYNKRMTKRTRRKRGGENVRPENLSAGNKYKITIDNESKIYKFVEINQSSSIGVSVFIFEGYDGRGIFYGDRQINNVVTGDAWIMGGNDDDGPQDSDNIQNVPDYGYFIHDYDNTYRLEYERMPGRKKVSIEFEATATGGRRRRRKRRTKRKNKKKRRKRRCTKKKRRKRR